jgi:hypothetical protein
VFAVAREHMDKEASVVGRGLQSLGRMFSGGTGRLGNVGSRLVDRGERMVARSAATAAAKQQNRVIDQALKKKLPSLSPAQQVRTREAVNARSAQRLSEARQMPPAMADRPPMSPPVQTPSPGAPPVAAAPVPAAPSPSTVPGAPPAPGGQQQPMLSPAAKRYLALGAGGIGLGAVGSGAIGGAQAGMNQPQVAPAQYPPGY